MDEPTSPAVPAANDDDLAAWQRPEVFSPRPSDSPQGYISPRGKVVEVDSREALAAAVAGQGKYSVEEVWCDDDEFCRPPEHVPWLGEAVIERTVQGVHYAIADARKNCLIFGILFAWGAGSRLFNNGWDLAALSDAPVVIMSGLLLTMLGLLPLYEAHKAQRRSARLQPKDVPTLLGPEACFDRWIHKEKAPLTIALTTFLVLAYVAQFLASQRSGPAFSVITAGGLDKNTLAQGKELWRFGTAPFLHDGLIHIFFNGTALFFLGKRVEILARRDHLFPVYVLGAILGGLFSYWARSIYPQPSVGASGAICGLLGFLIVFEFLHPRLCPRSARRRLLAGLIGLAAIGLVGVKLIDNAAHLGGLVAGAAYAGAIFPPSRSPHRPKNDRPDKVISWICGAIIIAAFLFTLSRLLGGGN